MNKQISATSKSPLKSGYLVPYEWMGYIFWVVNHIFERFFRKRTEKFEAPKAIIVCCAAHLGDLLLSAKNIAILRKEYPNSNLYLLTSSWCKPLANSINGITSIVYVDHWKFNRSNISKIQKVYVYAKSFILAAIALRRLKCDAGIDLYAYYPNNSLLLAISGVRQRIGINTGGLEFLYNEIYKLNDPTQNVVKNGRELLGILGINSNNHEKTNLLLKDSVLPKGFELPPSKYVVLHPGAGDEKKLWKQDSWIEIIDFLTTNHPHLHIVLTGSTLLDKSLCTELYSKRPLVINMAGKTDWLGFCYLIQNCYFTICLDSVALHIATNYNKHVVSLFSGMSNSDQWCEGNDRVKIITNEVECSPCFNGKGCDQMKCIKDITVLSVISTLNKYLLS